MAIKYQEQWGLHQQLWVKWMPKYIDRENKFNFLKILNISCKLVAWEEGKLLRYWFCTNSTPVFQNAKGNLHTWKVSLRKSLLSSPAISFWTNPSLRYLHKFNLGLTVAFNFDHCPPDCCFVLPLSLTYLVPCWSDVSSLFLLPPGHHCKCECFKLLVNWNKLESITEIKCF